MGEGLKPELSLEPGLPEPVLETGDVNSDLQPTSEKKFSVRCEICQGWHATQMHPDYTQEGRVKIKEMIEKRADSSYNFNTLGIEAVEKDKEDEWQHAVVEKAKELGDDLQNSNFLIHMGPLNRTVIPRDDKDLRYESVLSVLTQQSLGQGPDLAMRKSHSEWWFSVHLAGGKNFAWSELPQLAEMLEKQEEFVSSRNPESLKEYKKLITQQLNEIIIGLKFNIKHNKRKDMEEILVYAGELLEKLDNMEGRKSAVKFIMNQSVFGKGEGEKIGIICKVSERMKSNKNIKYDSAEGNRYEPIYNVEDRNGAAFARYISDLDNKRSGHYYKNQEQVTVDIPLSNSNTEDAQNFFADFVHGIYVSNGSVEEQQEVLERMLELTKDKPERRVPLYNYYGKLIWPRPPK